MRTRPSLSSDDVKKMLAACEAEAAKNNWSVAVAILDDGGHRLLGAFIAWTACGRFRRESRSARAHTSAVTSRPSKFFEDRVRGTPPAFAGFPAGTLIQGGVPVMHQNECVGAIGVSGVSSEDDEKIALAGVKALG